MIKNILIIVISVTLISSTAVMAGNVLETKSSPNYMIILVHGINTPGFVFRGHGENGSDVKDIPDNLKGFGDLLGYMRNDFGLDGYVYYYTFSQRDGRIENQARELGDRNYHNLANQGSVMNHKGLTDQPDINPSDKTYPYLGYPATIKEGNCWLEQAREDFREWFKKSGPGKSEDRYPTEAEIPQKYIFICHSMGGLVARTYLSSDYYNNDVVAIITIDSQHLGSDGAEALKRIYDFYNSGNREQPAIAAASYFGMAVAAFCMDWDMIGQYCMINAFIIPPGRILLDEVLTKRGLGWYPNQPGVQDMNSQGTFISTLNSRDFILGNQPMKARFIYSGECQPPQQTCR